jgi:hypothetical protein
MTRDQYRRAGWMRRTLHNFRLALRQFTIAQEPFV